MSLRQCPRRRLQLLFTNVPTLIHKYISKHSRICIFTLYLLVFGFLDSCFFCVCDCISVVWISGIALPFFVNACLLLYFFVLLLVYVFIFVFCSVCLSGTVSRPTSRGSFVASRPVHCWPVAGPTLLSFFFLMFLVFFLWLLLSVVVVVVFLSILFLLLLSLIHLASFGKCCWCCSCGCCYHCRCWCCLTENLLIA